MSAELEIVPLSALQVREQVNLIQEVMQYVMKDGTHFGKVPGAGDKPTLFKAGAEKLASTFRLAIDPIVEELSHGDEFRVRVIARVTEMGTGRFLGAGVGECSSSESKYMWRAAVCDEEYDAALEMQRRVKWNKGKLAWSQKQVRMNVADVANTVLKMAKKRAMVDGILTVTGASDIFTQDIEELPKEYLDQKQERSAPNPTPGQGSTGIGIASSGIQTNPSRTQSSEPVQSLHSNGNGEPDIRPRSQKGAPSPTQPLAASPGPNLAQQPASEGQVVDAEPSITDKQQRMFFAISRSANLSDEQVRAALAKIGYHGHRDNIPKARFQEALDAIDPGYRFHQQKSK